MAQHNVQLNVTQSTFLDKANPNTNYGNLEYLRSGIKDIEWHGMVGDIVSRYTMLINWPHDVIPPRKKIISATLALYSRRFVAADPDGMLHMHEVRKGWDESTATYNNASWSRSSATYYEYHGDIPLNSMLYFGLRPSIIYDPNGVAIDGPRLESASAYAEFNSTRASSNKPYIDVVYEDVPPDKPTLIAPIGIYKDSKSVIRFEWQYNSDVGGTQKAFDLQWSTDQANWTTVSLTTANNYYDMPADILPAGNIYWRVRTYNEYDEVGPYSDIQSFYAIGAPAAPVLNAIPTNTARPTVTWSAFSQQVYQLQVLSGDTIVYDSGVVPGISIRSHKVKAWLDDGTYTVQLRIKNEYDLWSDWGSATVTISTIKPEKPILTAEKTATGIKLTVPAGRTLIYRDGVCIGETNNGEYIDNAVANGREYSYTVRAVQGYPERQITNLLGSGGDCESLDVVLNSRVTAVLDNTEKVFGLNSIKITANADNNYHSVIYQGTGAASIPIADMGLAVGDYVSFSAYLKTSIGKARLYILFFDASDTQISSTYTAVYSPLSFTRAIKSAVIPANTTKIRFQITLADDMDRIVFAGTGENTNIDGLMALKITEEEYNNLTEEELLAKYPYGNNTFIAPADETFTDSDPVTATAEFKHSLIAPASDLADIFTFTRSLNAPPKRTYNLQPGGAFVEYAGRKHPVWEPTEHVNAAWQMSFYLKAWAEVEAFVALVDRKETVLYRDARGRKVYGILSNLTINDERGGYTVGFTLTEVDYIEGVDV